MNAGLGQPLGQLLYFGVLEKRMQSRSAAGGIAPFLPAGLLKAGQC